MADVRGGQLNRKALELPEKRGRVNEKGIYSARPVLRDVVHDIVGDEPGV
jgi:hypothetical protein